MCLSKYVTCFVQRNFILWHHTECEPNALLRCGWYAAYQ